MEQDIILAIIKLWLVVATFGGISFVIWWRRRQNFAKPSQVTAVLRVVSSVSLSRSTRVAVVDFNGQRWLITENANSLIVERVTSSVLCSQAEP